jgi:chromosome segregation ATPase
MQQLQTDTDATIASKNAEIQSLTSLLEQARQQQQQQQQGGEQPAAATVPMNDDVVAVNQQLEAARKEVEEIRHHSQEEIYKRESRIRELEDRLSSGLGAYKVEDIRTRDEEIEELQAANEAAQDWMAKAVEHHKVFSAQVASLSEEKAALSTQLDQAKGQLNPANANEASVKLLENELSEKLGELEQVKADLAKRDQELQVLHEEKNSAQGLQQALGITRDDLAILQRQLEQSQSDVKTLEFRLAENALFEENESLKASTTELEGRLEEFQSWADMAQKKIAEIIAAKESVDQLLSTANEQLKEKSQELQAQAAELEEKSAAVNEVVQSRAIIVSERYELVQKVEDLQSKLAMDSDAKVVPVAESESDKSVIDQLNAEIATLQSTNQTQKSDFDELETRFNELQAWTEGAQEKIAEIFTAKEKLGAQLATEKEIALNRQDEIEQLKKDLAESSQQTLTTGSVATVIQETGERANEGNDAAMFFGVSEMEMSSPGEGNIVDHLQAQLRQKEEELKSFQETLEKDEDVVHKWEGK